MASNVLLDPENGNTVWRCPQCTRRGDAFDVVLAVGSGRPPTDETLLQTGTPEAWARVQAHVLEHIAWG